MEYTDQLVASSGRIGQRAEDIEQGSHTQFAAYRCGVLHRAVVIGRKHKPHTRLAYALSHLIRRQVQIYSERLENIRAAGFAGYGSPAMLCDLCASRCGNEHGCRRNVVSM